MQTSKPKNSCIQIKLRYFIKCLPYVFHWSLQHCFEFGCHTLFHCCSGYACILIKVNQFVTLHYSLNSCHGKQASWISTCSKVLLTSHMGRSSILLCYLTFIGLSSFFSMHFFSLLKLQLQVALLSSALLVLCPFYAHAVCHVECYRILLTWFISDRNRASNLRTELGKTPRSPSYAKRAKGCWLLPASRKFTIIDITNKN